MGQFFGIEDIKELTKASQTTTEWAAGSVLRIGGQQYNVTSVLTLNTASDIDTGTVANDTIYYIYAVVVAGTVSLKYSLSSTAPTGFPAYRKIGAFQTDESAEVVGTSVQDYGSVGDIIQSMLTEEQFIKENGAGWVLADGRSAVGSKYATLIASSPTPVQFPSNVPDLRGRFLRGRNNGRLDGKENPDGEFNLGQEQGDATAANGLGATTNGGGNHSHSVNQYVVSFSSSGPIYSPSAGSATTLGGDGAHNHPIVVSSSDNETRSANTTVNYFIKIEDIAI